ncbi:MAG: amino acid permease [Acidimicrobiales bacterium]
MQPPPAPDAERPAAAELPSFAARPGPLAEAAEVSPPESLRYRLKELILGPPLSSRSLDEQSLGVPTALGVLSPDVISSCAYGTESILRILVPAVGVAAFSLVTPITALLIGVLALVTICYRYVVSQYPTAGGSYVVARENFNATVAQIPGAGLLMSYVLTVSVSVAAGVDAIASALPALQPYVTPLCVLCVLLLTYGNLRGIREAGRAFAAPTYFFLLNLGILLVLGIGTELAGGLPVYHMHAAGSISVGRPGTGLLEGAGAFIFLRAFANGGSSMTGTEAVSNAVSIFREPRARRARTTLVVMSSTIGTAFLGVSILASFTHALPYVSGTPTVLSQIGRAVYGSSGAGTALYGALQLGTALVLVFGANTSFNGFPFLVSFIAEDAYLPRRLTRRGHRLVYSQGIAVLAILSIALLVATNSQVATMIPLYATTVFVGFTVAGAGMTKHYMVQRGWRGARLQILLNGAAFVASAAVVVIFSVTQFTRGAWLVVVLLPILVLLLRRVRRSYEHEESVLGAELSQLEEPPAIQRHVVLLLVDRIDPATIHSLRYARGLLADDLKAVHVAVDEQHAERLAQRWSALGLDRVPLEVVSCPHRRVERTVLEVASLAAADGAEVTVVLASRSEPGLRGRLLHDHTAHSIVAGLEQLSQVEATMVPFRVRHRRDPRVVPGAAAPATRDRVAALPVRKEPELPAPAIAGRPAPAGATAAPATPGGIAALQWRTRARLRGDVRSVEVRDVGSSPALVCHVSDGTGGILLVFLGRRAIPGIAPDMRLSAEGTVGKLDGKLAMFNPSYELDPVHR